MTDSSTTRDLTETEATSARRSVGGRRPRLRSSLRWLMVAILLVGLLCGWYKRAQDLHDRRVLTLLALGEQYRVTSEVMSQAVEDLAASRRDITGWINGESRDGPFCPPWTHPTEVWVDGLAPGLRTSAATDHRIIHFTIRGGPEGIDLKPIVVEDHGCQLNAPMIERLANAYRDHEWAFKVVPVPNGSVGPPWMRRR